MLPDILRQVGQIEPVDLLTWFLAIGYRINVIPEDGSPWVPLDPQAASRAAGARHHLDLLMTP